MRPNKEMGREGDNNRFAGQGARKLVCGSPGGVKVTSQSVFEELEYTSSGCVLSEIFPWLRERLCEQTLIRLSIAGRHTLRIFDINP